MGDLSYTDSRIWLMMNQFYHFRVLLPLVSPDRRNYSKDHLDFRSYHPERCIHAVVQIFTRPRLLGYRPVLDFFFLFCKKKVVVLNLTYYIPQPVTSVNNPKESTASNSYTFDLVDRQYHLFIPSINLDLDCFE